MPSNQGGDRRPAARKRASAAPTRSAFRGGAPAQERELRSQGRKTMQRLLDAGRYVFERRGFHVARVDDIVKVAKTSHGTFYLYFANKEDLFKALAVDAMTEMEELGNQLPPITPDVDGQALLREWVTKFVDTYARHGNVIRAWTEGEFADKELGTRARDLLIRLSGLLAARIAEAGHLDGQAEIAGVACLSMLERFNYFQQAHQVQFSRDESIDALTRAVFEGFFMPDKLRRGRRRPTRRS
ncbi:MAG TPA: TetR/AcrR family transcriptional regulator [Mycobacteriales bacterium]|nr:TetR/AcrR family transcriptional regulator [Mycobacteriales bacterium]